MHQFAGLFRVFFFYVFRPLQNIKSEPSDLFTLSFGNSFSGSKLFCFFWSNHRLLFLLSSMEIWWWEYRMSYSLSKMKKRIETSLVSVKIHGLFKKYLDWNCSGCSLGGMCLQPVLTCSYMS
jgi:hypothetical protein